MDKLIREEENQPFYRDASALFLSMLGIGHAPKMPGTVASIVTAILLYFLSIFKLPHFFYIPFLLITFVGGTFIAEAKVGKLEDPDKPWIVIDEFIGMMATWIIAAPTTISGHLIILIFFRLFDIWKPWPIHIIDEKWTHGVAIMLDDFVAGIYAGIISILIFKYVPIIF